MGRALLVILVLSGQSLAGCAPEVFTRLTLLFPDTAALERTAHLRVAALIPGPESSCQSLLTTPDAPWEAGCLVETEALVENPAQAAGQPLVLEQVDQGRRFFYAQARDQAGRIFLQGCRDRRVGTVSSQRVTIFLGPVELDTCSVCEAEDSLTYGTEIYSHEGASGGYRVREFGETGDFIEFSPVGAGSTVNIRYSLRYDLSRQASVYVNGQDRGDVIFPATGTWDNYATVQLALDVAQFDAVRLQIDPHDAEINAAEKCASIDNITIEP